MIFFLISVQSNTFIILLTMAKIFNLQDFTMYSPCCDCLEKICPSPLSIVLMEKITPPEKDWIVIETEWDVSTLTCPGLWPVLRCYFVYVRSQLWPLLDTESLPQIFEGWGRHQVHMVIVVTWWNSFIVTAIK